MKIYTKTGDHGTTSLVGGTRVAKTHVRLEAYGTVDELNAQLGVLLTHLAPMDGTDAYAEEVRRVQNRLFVVGSLLATEADSPFMEKIPHLAEADVARLESSIDTMQAELPPLKAFVLPEGTPAAVSCHVCRTVCRRAERRVLAMADTGIPVGETLLRYLNRLSDWLFVMARRLNDLAGCGDIYWEET